MQTLELSIKSIGTVSDLEGKFSLAIPDSLLNEKITISRIGYETATFEINSLQRDLKKVLYLQPTTYQLKEVTVIAKKLKLKTLGNVSKKGFALAINSESKGREVGTVIKMPKNKTAFLKDFNFNILSNSPDSAVFRLNIYSVENQEFKNILHENIYFTLKQEVTGEYRIDLSPYHIEVNNDIFVSLEFLDIFSNVNKETLKGSDIYFYNRINISSTLLGSPSYVRNTSLSKWIKLPKTAAPSFWMTVSY